MVEQCVCCLCVCVVAASGNTAQTLNQFLASFHLLHLEDVLLANGFDELDFMVVGFYNQLYSSRKVLIAVM